MELLNFCDLQVSTNIHKALEALGFQTATPIQSEAIPVVLEGHDVIGLAQTGTGKTLAFGLPIIEKVDKDSDAVQVLVLSPTRELALQITNELRKFCAFEEGVRILTVYGGESIDKQILALKKRPQIIVGTPGRIMDHMRRRTLRLHNIDMVVLDEADEMLNMGFQEDIDTILQDIPETKQMVMFSATFPDALMKIARTYQKDPITINVRNKEVTVKNIKQCSIETTENNKFEVVSRLLDGNDFRLTLIFCNTKRKVDEVAEYLHIHGYRVKALHGDMKQKERDFVMNLFRKSQIDVLIATDVAARGIDVDEIDAVINYDVPQDEEYYVHRIGRTGRAGREGISYLLYTGRQKNKLRFIEKLTKTPLVSTKVPTMKEIESKRMNLLFSEIVSNVGDLNANVEEYMPQLLDRTKLTSEELTAVLFSLLIKERFPQSHDDIPNELVTAVEKGFKRLYLNLGNEQRVSPGAIIKILASESGVSGKNFGAIDISTHYSFVEIPERMEKQLLAASGKGQYNGKRLEISAVIEEAWKSQGRSHSKDFSKDKDWGGRSSRKSDEPPFFHSKDGGARSDSKPRYAKSRDGQGVPAGHGDNRFSAKDVGKRPKKANSDHKEFGGAKRAPRTKKFD